MILSQRYNLVANRLYRARARLALLIVPAAVASLFIATPFQIMDGRLYLGVCFACSLAGFVVRGRAIAVTAYRNRHMAAHPEWFPEPFPSEGIYSRIRYPLYAGNFLIWLGVILYVGVGWFVAGALAAYLVCYGMILGREEQAMLRRYGASYRAWCKAVPAVIPDRRKSRRAAGHRLRAVVSRDFRAFMGILFTFLLLGAVKYRVVHFTWEMPLGWLVALAASLALLLLSSAVRRRK